MVSASSSRRRNEAKHPGVRVDLASQRARRGSIGRLAGELDMSKAGVFAHFAPKKIFRWLLSRRQRPSSLRAWFRHPSARSTACGCSRLSCVFDYIENDTFRGGCFFTAAAAELDGRPGPVRDRLVESIKAWLGLLGEVTREAIREGHLRKASRLSRSCWSSIRSFSARIGRDSSSRTRMPCDRCAQPPSRGLDRCHGAWQTSRRDGRRARSAELRDPGRKKLLNSWRSPGMAGIVLRQRPPMRSRRRPFDGGSRELFDSLDGSRVRFDVVKAGLDQRVINLSTLFGNDRPDRRAIPAATGRRLRTGRSKISGQQ